MSKAASFTAEHEEKSQTVQIKWMSALWPKGLGKNAVMSVFWCPALCHLGRCLAPEKSKSGQSRGAGVEPASSKHQGQGWVRLILKCSQLLNTNYMVIFAMSIL